MKILSVFIMRILMFSIIVGFTWEERTPQQKKSESLFGDLFTSNEVDPQSLGVVEVRIYFVDRRGFLSTNSLSTESRIFAKTSDPQRIKEIIHAFHRENRIKRTETISSAFKVRHKSEWHLIALDSRGVMAYARCIESKSLKGIIEVRGYLPTTYYVKCDIIKLINTMHVVRISGADLKNRLYESEQSETNPETDEGD